ncbi:MAG: hypothetical protein NTY77_00095 [Elusimicrobia bacterium]|nr:hypothetical protein [Elusimicrobiota bacterium]
MKNRAFLLALMLAALPCRAGELEAWKASAFAAPPGLSSDALSKGFGLAMKGAPSFALPDIFPRYEILPQGLPVPGFQMKSAGEVVARLDLAKDMDKYLATGLVFRTRRGKAFHVAMNRVENCADGSNKCGEQDKYFILFTPDQGELRSANAYAIANYSVFKSGKKDIAFDQDGVVYTVKLRLSGMSVEAVRAGTLEVTCSRQVVFTATVNQLIDALSSQAGTVDMGKRYMAFLGRDLYQTQGQDAYFGKTARLNLIPAGAQNVTEIYTLPLSGMTASGVVYPSFAGYAFRQIPGQAVEIYKLD